MKITQKRFECRCDKGDYLLLDSGLPSSKHIQIDMYNSDTGATTVQLSADDVMTLRHQLNKWLGGSE